MQILPHTLVQFNDSEHGPGGPPVVHEEFHKSLIKCSMIYVQYSFDNYS